MEECTGFEGRFVKMEPLQKGWSSDKKYVAEDADGKVLLLRIADQSAGPRRKAEYDMMRKAAALGVPMPQPLEFGTCNGGQSVYTLFSWCEGEDAEAVLPELTDTEQYVLGWQSGEMLKRLHSIPAPAELEEWEHRFGRKIRSKVEKYQACGIRFDGDGEVMAYIEQNLRLLANRPQCYQHGDYHVGNMVISPELGLSVIDFDRSDFGDPWEEFNQIVWSAHISPHFATGQLNGYFGGRPPEEFFRLLALYIAVNTLSSVPWAMPFGEEEVAVMLKQAGQVLAWFDGMGNPVPAWYLGEPCIQYLDGLPYRLKTPFDLSFVSGYGRVFKIFDDQDSGNICFGVETDGKRLFIKYAGAPTQRYDGEPEDAIGRLKATVPVYQDLAHPHLVRLLGAEEIGGGYAAVFEWSGAECMSRQYPRSRKRFQQMTPEARLSVFADILDFHAHVAEKGYVAIDFYDGSIMYDFSLGKTVICDIDLYAKRPYTNRMGRMWGSSRFMAPEEFQLEAAIDEVTNVYLMGATAFVLFAGNDRTLEGWPLNGDLYEVAARAVCPERSGRQTSIRQFMAEWFDAGGCSAARD